MGSSASDLANPGSIANLASIGSGLLGGLAALIGAGLIANSLS